MLEEKILITGAGGQLGLVLRERLQEKWGFDNVIATDLKFDANFNGHFEILDATDFEAMQKLVVKYKVTEIYHLVAVLSAKGETYPLNTWDINMKTFFNVLEVSRLQNVKKVFYPSSIAVFGPNVQRLKTPQFSNLTPTTVYGMSKVAGENWANYYFEKYGLDVRSLRYPGVIGYQSLPGGGTTDYAVDMFHKAIKNEDFECFLDADTILPMIYMDDVIDATINLMDAPGQNISVRTSYNLAGLSFSPKELATAVQKFYPNFSISYKPDFRQKIADSWPLTIDDNEARLDWGWKPKFGLEEMTKVMIDNLKLKQFVNN
ncbi:NAD-dependent epimerase/dehydratase family protein [Hyunsoonleella aestuarii]|uniref:NAD-dependent epimerase/dehydratase family protein n=1 Tax=Hyunsoonleella aestuarii TaxID=912802 RepID=A0ABP8EDY1_9FLAO|nr:NAD-dependent epimerase/dehydratase family protein [Hyunsoonleella aestuarii]